MFRVEVILEKRNYSTSMPQKRIYSINILIQKQYDNIVH